MTARRDGLALVAATLALLCCRADAMFLLLTPNSPQCFIVEYPPDTQLTLDYAMPALAEGASKDDGSRGATVSLMDRRGKKQVFSRQVSNERGQLSFSTVSEEAHELCISSTGKTVDPLRFNFAFEVGQGDGYYEEMATQEHMDKLQLAVVKLNDELSQILSEADYMKEKEMDFHTKSEHMNTAAQYWPILQVAILLITGVFQAKHLKSFFQSKRLV